MRKGITLLFALVVSAALLTPKFAFAQKSGGSTNGEGGGGAEWHCFTCANLACPQSDEMSYYVKDDTPPYGNFGSTYGGSSFCQMGGCPSPGTCVPLLASRTTSEEAMIYLAKAA